MLTDVPQPGGAQDGVRDRVREHVCVGVPLEPELERDLDAAEHEPPPGGEAVRVDPQAGPHPIVSSRRVRPSKTAISRTPTESSSSAALS